MPQPYRITIEHGNVPRTIAGEIDQETWNLLFKFEKRVEEIKQTRLIAAGCEIELTFKLDAAGMSITGKLPSQDDLAVLPASSAPIRS